jgi:hypothetical protein
MTIATLLAVLGLALAYQDSPKEPDLAFRLIAMSMADQEVRSRWVEQMKAGKTSPAIVHEMQATDRANTQALKEIVDRHGWPTKSLVGKKASHEAWLLVQHADLDPDFQERCLKLMEPLVKVGEVVGSDYAYLFDRVASARGRKQRYGTQFELKNGEWVAKPIEDPKSVDKRRKAVGMSSLAEYKRLLERAYGKPPKAGGQS